MNIALEKVNELLRSDPAAFIADCDASYTARIEHAADMICDNFKNSPIVLLSGPSGSGKTTTALKIRDILSARGIKTHAISMDNYFKTINHRTAPRTPEGEIDYESPVHLDMELLNEHFTMLTKGETIHIPYFIFSRQKRSASISTPLKLEKNEVAIFEGIHALNDDITNYHPEAFKLYISASSQFTQNDELLFERTWLRLLRRMVRDNNFRGSSAAETLSMWASVLRGEILYINPFKYKADLRLDTTHPYEVSLMKNFALPLLKELPAEGPRAEELQRMIPALEKFEAVDASYIPKDALLREFIGGGIYEY